MDVSFTAMVALGLAGVVIAGFFFWKIMANQNMRNGLPVEVRTRDGLVFEQSYAWPGKYHLAQCSSINPSLQARQYYGDKPLTWRDLWPKLSPLEQTRWAKLKPT